MESQPTMEKFHKATFENIGPEKQNRILQVAISEFAARGYSAASINTIAAKAGISIGSLYSYFESKEALFLTIMDRGYRVLEEALSRIDIVHQDVFQAIKQLLESTIQYSRQYQQLTQIYLDMSTEGLNHLSRRLSSKMEKITAEFLRRLLRRGRDEGFIDPKLNDRIAAFCIDNLIIMLQHSYASGYFRERMKVFLGEEAEDDGLIVRDILQFLKGALAAGTDR